MLWLKSTIFKNILVKKVVSMKFYLLACNSDVLYNPLQLCRVPVLVEDLHKALRVYHIYLKWSYDLVMHLCIKHAEQFASLLFFFQSMICGDVVEA